MTSAHKEKRAFYERDEVDSAARSVGWDRILLSLAPGVFEEALEKYGRHVTCPFHGTSNKNGKGDGFRMYPKGVDTGTAICNKCGTFDGYELLMAANKWDFYESMCQVAGFCGVAPKNKKYPQKTSSKPAQKALDQSNVVSLSSGQEEPSRQKCSDVERRSAEIEKRVKLIRERNINESARAADSISRIWKESLSIEYGLPEPFVKYLHKRRIIQRSNKLIAGDNIRFHPSLPYYEENEEGEYVLVRTYPAIIKAIRDKDNNIVTLHRTYLTVNGNKAPVKCARKMMTIPDDFSATGAAIKLGGDPVHGVLGVGEGFETAMSPLKIYGFPVWSTVNATLLEKFEPPKNVHTLFIWEDKDISGTGQLVGKALKERLEIERDKINVIRLSPNRPIPKGRKSIDWNDVMVREGVYGFPSYRQINRIVQESQRGRIVR